jgi:cardiolipin-specific phospholipase
MDMTPQSLVRSSGPMGFRMIRGYINARFQSLSEEDRSDMVEYLHGITMLEGSGEYSLNRLLQPGAWGRRPLANKLTALKMPTLFMCTFRDISKRN